MIFGSFYFLLLFLKFYLECYFYSVSYIVLCNRFVLFFVIEIYVYVFYYIFFSGVGEDIFLLFFGLRLGFFFIIGDRMCIDV